MNAERLHAIALAVRSDLDQTGVVGVIGALRDALKNQVGAAAGALVPAGREHYSAAVAERPERSAKQHLSGDLD